MSLSLSNARTLYCKGLGSTLGSWLGIRLGSTLGSCLGISLGSTLGIFTPLLVGVLAYTFLGLDALSSELEEPFGTQSNDLPLDSMVRTIEIELLGTLGKPTPPPIQAQDNNLL